MLARRFALGRLLSAGLALENDSERSMREPRSPAVPRLTFPFDEQVE
jgi:hypothetical protein